MTLMLLLKSGAVALKVVGIVFALLAIGFFFIATLLIVEIRRTPPETWNGQAQIDE